MRAAACGLDAAELALRDAAADDGGGGGEGAGGGLLHEEAHEFGELVEFAGGEAVEDGEDGAAE